MPRKPRVQYAGAVYHVMSRGDRREAIFLDDWDRERFIETLAEARERTGWRIHALTLMINHYHLLLETPEPNLVVGMQWLQGTYTVRFNGRHGLDGHLFQGRYKALPVSPDEEGYFLRVSTYIHLNPVRARLIDPKQESLLAYPWSSYPEYLKPANRRAEWLDVDRVLGELRLADTARGRAQYAEYMERLSAETLRKDRREVMEQEWSQIRRGWFLGSERFREQIQAMVGTAMADRSAQSYSGQEVLAHGEAAAKRALTVGMSILGMTNEELLTTKKADARKQVLAWWIRGRTTVRNAWVAQALYMGHPGNVSRYVRQVADGATPELRALKKKLGEGEKLSKYED